MWKLVLAVVAVVVAVVEGGLLYAAAPQDRGQYHRTNSGSYNYGYNTGDGVAKVEVKRADGSVVGSYRYFDPNGKQIVRSYIADSKGFRILGNDLPISLETPAAAILGAPALTAPVEGASNAVVDASVHPSKRHNTVDIEALTSSTPVIQQYRQAYTLGRQSDLLQQQQQAIYRMEQQLADLKQQQALGQLVDSSASTASVSSVAAPADTVQYNTIQDGGSQGEAQYYYYPYRYNYDFPAGFAYDTAPVEVVDPPSVIGVKGLEAERLSIAAGRTKPRFPERSLPIQVVRSTDQQSYQTPYVIGRMR